MQIAEDALDLEPIGPKRLKSLATSNEMYLVSGGRHPGAEITTDSTGCHDCNAHLVLFRLVTDGIDQAFDFGRDNTPIAKPIARKSYDYIGRIDALAVEAHAGCWPGAVAAAAHQKIAGRLRIIDQIFALVGRAIRKRQYGEPLRSWHRTGARVPRIDVFHPLGRRQRIAGGRNCNKQAFERF